MKLVSTCPVFGMGWDPICADYLMGYIFECPGYPPKEDIDEAPSTCMPEYIAVAEKIKNGSIPIDVPLVLRGNYSDYCYQKCFQDYIDATYAYNANGCPVLPNLTILSYPLKAFRGIACGSTNGTQETEKNCYDIAMNVVPDLSPTDSPPASPNPFTDYSCSMLTTRNGIMAYSQICSMLSSNECCHGNQAAMLAQVFANPFPPCLMKQCYVNSKAIHSFCGSHINFATGTIEVWVSLEAPPPMLPNMYSETAVAMFHQNLVIPFLAAINPTELTSFDFTYYDVNGLVISQNYYPNAYNPAVRGDFGFTFTLINITEAELKTYITTLSSPSYIAFLASSYGVPQTAVNVAVKKSSFFAADPIQVLANP